MTTTISPKYQIVIPENVRRQLNIKPGQKMQVETGSNGSIIIKHAKEAISINELNKYAGTIKTAETMWGKQKLDPAIWIRKQREVE